MKHCTEVVYIVSGIIPPYDLAIMYVKTSMPVKLAATHNYMSPGVLKIAAIDHVASNIIYSATLHYVSMRFDNFLPRF